MKELSMKIESNITAGLILAAGMSSRMSDFKPLIKLGEKTIIEHSIDTLIDGGVQDIVIVIGNNAESLKRHINNKKVSFIYNPSYKTSTMFDSAKLGIKFLEGKCNQFFFMPADVPLFKCHSIKEMIRTFEKNNYGIIQPIYRGQDGHPVLVSAKHIRSILNYKGHEGMKGALGDLKVNNIRLSLPDKGLLLDVDTPNDFIRILNHYESLSFPDKEICLEIHKFCGTDDQILRHCMAVANVAEEWGAKLKKNGGNIDLKLVQASALLHDIGKKEKNHAQVGAKWIRDLGYDEVAWVINEHMNISEEAIEKLDERSIVYLADKLVNGDKVVDLDSRQINNFEKYGDNESAKKNSQIRINKAKEIMERVLTMEDK